MVITGVSIKDLEEYNILEQEIETLKKELLNIYRMARTESDIVTGSLVDFPWTKTSFQVVGDDRDSKDRIAGLKALLEDRHKRLVASRLATEEYIESVEDSEIRLIITLKYIKGFTWLEVSNRIYGYPSEDRARKKLERYLSK